MNTTLVVAVALLAALGAVRLSEIEHSYLRDEIVATQMETLISDTRSAAWAVVIGAKRAEEGVEPLPAPVNLVQLEAKQAEWSAWLARDDLPGDARAPGAAYERDLASLNAHVRAGRYADAEQAAITGEAAYEAVRAAAHAERAQALEAAEMFHAIRQWATILLVLGAAGAISVVFWRSERSRRRNAEVTARQLWRLAYLDTLTGLPNRVQFVDHLQSDIKHAHDGTPPVAILFIDLDNFKTINDTLGHSAGDELLTMAAARIAEAAERDVSARLGGDEFAVIVREDATGGREQAVATRIKSAMEQPFPLPDGHASARCSIGLARSTGAETAEELMRNADVAMYVAKSRGKNRVELFEPAMHPELIEVRELSRDLELALTRGELVNYYQPVMDMETGRIAGAEALLRWHHPVRGLIPPGRFIPLAEQSGLILPIGLRALSEALKTGADWRGRFPELPPLQMHVNVSAQQLYDDLFVHELATIMRAFAVDPATVTLELTESMAQDGEMAIGKMRQLRELGVRLTIDDFGTGYSSLSYLQDLPVTGIKIDRSFTERVGDERDAGVTRSIVELGHSLNLDIVVEGVEHEAQVAVFRGLGCRWAQGYFYGPAVTADEFAALLAREAERVAGALLAA